MTTLKATMGPWIAWHISSYSDSGVGQCVEAGPYSDGSARFAMRDSQHRTLATLTVPRAEWAAFLDVIRADEFS